MSLLVLIGSFLCLLSIAARGAAIVASGIVDIKTAKARLAINASRVTLKSRSKPRLQYVVVVQNTTTSQHAVACLKSLLASTPKLPIVVVLNKPTKTTAKTVKVFVKSHQTSPKSANKIKFIITSKHQITPMPAILSTIRTRLLGTTIIVLDADTVVTTGFYSALQNYLQAHPHATNTALHFAIQPKMALSPASVLGSLFMLSGQTLGHLQGSTPAIDHSHSFAVPTASLSPSKQQQLPNYTMPTHLSALRVARQTPVTSVDTTRQLLLPMHTRLKSAWALADQTVLIASFVYAAWLAARFVTGVPLLMIAGFSALWLFYHVWTSGITFYQKCVTSYYVPVLIMLLPVFGMVRLTGLLRSIISQSYPQQVY